MIKPERRAEELRLLAEYEKAGKIRRIDYIPPELDTEDEETVYEFARREDAIDLGDGNKWKHPRGN